jgi:ornithine cyclodeaminase/alanine dehydrogenase-like protein (mu-crystallin family)
MTTLRAMRIIDADRLVPSLDPLSLIEDLRQGHQEGIDAAERLLLSERAGSEEANHLLIWPAWKFGRAAGAKLVTVFPRNERHGRGPNIHSVYILFGGEDGRPRCLISGESFTRWKTAADSALGATFLARDDARVLTVIGAGAQAMAQIRFLRAARPSITRVSVWNRTPAKARSLVHELASSRVAAEPVEDLEAAVRSADIVSCLTSARTPVLCGSWLKPGTHVDLVGSFTPQMREADDETIRYGHLFVDSRQFTITQCGDIAIPIAKGVIRESDLAADLFDLCCGRAPGRLTTTEITVFKNGGGGHLDLMMAEALYRRAEGEAANSRR